MKRYIALILCAVLLFSLSGCKKESKKGKKTSETAVQETECELTLLYSKTDGFNPYTAKSSENRQLCSLLFDPLLNLKSDFTVEYCIASSAEVSASACTVHLRALNFTDGSPITSSDVVYSYSLARGAVYSGYPAALSEITAVSAPDPYTVVFTAAYLDPYILNLLTFPIIKNGTAGRTDSDGVELAPVGSGKYTVSADGTSLIRNDNYYGVAGDIKTVKLLNAPDSESISHYIEAGTADLYFTDADAGQIVRMSGKRSQVNINRLVYIGVNSTYGDLSSKEARYAISSAVDRKEIVTSAYYGVASSATSFFNPSLADARPTASLEETANAEITVENLSKIGYNVKDEDGYYVNKSDKRLSFSLLVNSDNVSRLSAARLVAAQCKNAGIEITVEEENFQNYTNRLASGNFQLYIGEIQILPNMDLAPLVVPGGTASYGVTETPTGNNQLTVSQAIAKYRSGALGVADLSGVMLTAMPQIPLCYRNGLLFYSDKIQSGVEGLPSNIYYSIEKYKF